MQSFFKLLVILVYVHLTSADDYAYFCRLQNAAFLPKMQILFLVDGDLSPLSNFTKMQRDYTKEFMRQTKQIQYQSEFAVAAYHSWENPETGNVRSCYTLLHNFTSNQTAINKQVESLAGDPTNDITRSKCSVSMALIMGMTDKNLSWVQDGPTVFIEHSFEMTRKFIVIYPFKLSLTQLRNTDGRRDPIGDGSDTCQNSIPPGSDFILHMMGLNDMNLLLVLWPPHGMAKELFKHYGSDGPIRYNHLSINEMACMYGNSGGTINYKSGVAGRAAGGDELPVDGEGWTEEQIGTRNFTDDAGQIFKICRGEVQMCDNEPDDSYNSLGL